MNLTVKYFASLREQLHCDQELVSDDGLTTVAKLRAHLIEQHGSQGAVLSDMLCAVNYEYVQDSHALRDGDEVAFFPPVTGG